LIRERDADLTGSGARSPRDQFAERAHRYERLDQALGGGTRFFAAAALTNRVLAELCAHRTRWAVVSASTIAALLELGCVLETVNVAWARSLLQQAGTCRGLDSRFIEIEQCIVERVLGNWARHRAQRYQHVVGEVDNLLRRVAAGLIPLCSPNAARYRRVLKAVSAAAGRSPSFAVLQDRIRIGGALLEECRVIPVSLTTSSSAQRFCANSLARRFATALVT
jgi:hypothetical protein